MNKPHVRIGLIFALFVVFFSALVAALPSEITVQGKLTNSSGYSATGTYNMSFKIYDSFANGNTLYQTTFNVTTDSNGVYDAILRNVNLNFSDQYYLGITVSTDNESSPRINLTSSPYSFRSNITEGLNPVNKYRVAEINVTGNFSVGQTALFVDSTNFLVGIGTPTPSYLLTVANVTNAVNLSGILYLNGSSGNVGIGTSGPLEKLDVRSNTLNGNIRLSSNGTSSGQGSQTIQFGINVDGTFNQTAVLGDTSGADSNLKIFAMQGNLFLGANTGGVASTRMVVGSSGGITIGGSDLASTSNLLYIDGASDVVVDTSGKVGIGTTTPAEMLAVIGNISASGNLSVGGEIRAVSYNFGWTNLSNYPAACNPGEFVTQVGDTLTCTAPGEVSTAAGGWSNDSVNTRTNLNVIIDTTVLVVNTSTNRVGINTATPQDALEVIGNVRVSGTLNASAVNVSTLLQIRGQNVQVEGTGFKVANFTSLYDAQASTRFGIGNYSTEYGSTGYKEANLSADLAGGVAATIATTSLTADTIVVNKNLYIIGNISNTNVANLNINGSLYPALDDFFSIGNGSLRWKNANLSGTLQAGTLQATNIFTTNLGGVALSSYNKSVDLSLYNYSVDLSSYNRSVSLNSYNYSVSLTGYLTKADDNATLGQWNTTSTAIYNRDFGKNVGIGVINPTNMLEVSHASSDSTIGIGRAGVTNGVINAPNNLFINIDSDNDATTQGLIIAKDRTSTTGGTELMRILENGNVGIGTSSPTALLYINDTQDVKATFVVQRNASATPVLFINASSQQTLVRGQNVQTEESAFKLGNVTALGLQVEANAFKIANYTALEASAFQIANYTALEASAFQKANYTAMEAASFQIANYSAEYGNTGFKAANFTTLYDAQASTRFGNANATALLDNNTIVRAGNLSTVVRTADAFNAGNFTSNFVTHNATSGQWNTSSTAIFNRDFGKNVGIGTSAPSKALVINSTTTANAITFDPSATIGPVMNTTGQNMTITSATGSVIIRLG